MFRAGVTPGSVRISCSRFFLPAVICRTDLSPQWLLRRRVGIWLTVDASVNPKNGDEVVWVISQLSAVVWSAGTNGVFFDSPTG
jgi:hypothetical protein